MLYYIMVFWKVKSMQRKRKKKISYILESILISIINYRSIHVYKDPEVHCRVRSLPQRSVNVFTEGSAMTLVVELITLEKNSLLKREIRYSLH